MCIRDRRQAAERRRVGRAQGDPQAAVGQLVRAVVRVVLGDPAAAGPDLDHDLRVLGRGLHQGLRQVPQLHLRRRRRLVQDLDLGDPVEPERAARLGTPAPGLDVGVPDADQADGVDLPLGDLVARGRVVADPQAAALGDRPVDVSEDSALGLEGHRQARAGARHLAGRGLHLGRRP